MLDIEPERGRAPGPAAARPDVPRRHRRGPHRRATRRSSPTLAGENPYEEWLHAGLIDLADLPEREHIVHTPASRGPAPAHLRLHRGGAEDPASPRWPPPAARPLGSMGTDTPIAVLSRAPAAALRLLHPAVRPGDQPAARRHPRGARHLARQLDRPRGQRPRRRPRRTPGRSCCPSRSSTTTSSPRSCTSTPTATCPATAPSSSRAPTTCTAARTPCAPGCTRSSPRCRPRSRDGARFVVLSDRDSDRDLAPIPSLLLTSAVHHHLIREKTRTQVGLVVEAGDVREVHHVALLVGYGAAAINPYLAMETVEDMVRARRHHRGHRGEGRRQPDQGARQGRAQGDVEDGHLDGGVLPRRPGLRGDRPVAGPRRRVLHRHRQPARRHRPRRHRRRDRGPARGRLPARRHPAGAPQAAASAASTSGAARASRTCSTPTPSSGCSTPPGRAATTSSSSTPRGSTSSPAG